MEPFTTEVDTPIKNGMPALMYGTQLSEEGLKCSIPRRDYNKLYEIWSCPRIVMNVAVSTRMFTLCVPFAYCKCGILDKKWHRRPPLSPPEIDCTWIGILGTVSSCTNTKGMCLQWNQLPYLKSNESFQSLFKIICNHLKTSRIN